MRYCSRPRNMRLLITASTSYSSSPSTRTGSGGGRLQRLEIGSGGAANSLTTGKMGGGGSWTAVGGDSRHSLQHDALRHRGPENGVLAFWMVSKSGCRFRLSRLYLWERTPGQVPDVCCSSETCHPEPWLMRTSPLSVRSASDL